MAASKAYLAVDLGASSGRIVAGVLEGGKLRLEEGHRFENGPVVAADNMHWDLLNQWSNIVQGLRGAKSKYGAAVASVGVDTWGVDFALLGRNDELLGNPFHYRDKRTVGILDKAFKIVSREEIFAETGLQFMEFNTLYQLLAMKLANSGILDAATSFLMIPDLFHWLLTGEKGNEYTDASTTQFLNPTTRDWSRSLLERFGIPTRMLGRLVQPGETLGKLRATVADETGLSGVSVVVPGTHDTASAVMAVPAASKPGTKPNWCYISSGTWSLMGVETPSPVITDACRAHNFTNEGGVGGTTRVLKNITGLWLVQECRRIWRQAGNEFGWTELVRRASESRPLISLLNPDHATLVAPKDMPQAIREFCKSTGQSVPQTEGEIIRCALESLALRYRMVLGIIEELIGGRIETIHIVGGGSQNRLLNQMTADACDRRVVAGPVEATAIGNIAMQAIACGDMKDIGEARELVRTSFNVEEFHPQNPGPWDYANERFQRLLASG